MLSLLSWAAMAGSVSVFVRHRRNVFCVWRLLQACHGCLLSPYGMFPLLSSNITMSDWPLFVPCGLLFLRKNSLFPLPRTCRHRLAPLPSYGGIVTSSNDRGPSLRLVPRLFRWRFYHAQLLQHFRQLFQLRNFAGFGTAANVAAARATGSATGSAADGRTAPRLANRVEWTHYEWRSISIAFQIAVLHRFAIFAIFYTVFIIGVIVLVIYFLYLR
mmetsp:Transcript_17222/g.36182  ORF Transcript_17222/g.36182 Transcript_17222/m.36182 type:complete len:216 (-) Transcript_17222:1310-1957(-)